MTSTGRRGYVGIDRRWLADPDLSDTALRFMLWLDSHTDEYLAATNISRAADQLGWGRNRVKRAIEELEGLGLISTEQIGHQSGGKVTRFTLHLTEWSDGPRWRDASRHGDATAMVHGDATTTSTPNDEESSSGTPKPPATTDVEVVPEWEVFFEQFWNAYPRRVGKPAAKRAMKKAHSMHSRRAIAEGTRAWIDYWTYGATPETFIPHPATFLNQDRFMDPTPALPSPKLSKAEEAIERIRNRDQ